MSAKAKLSGALKTSCLKLLEKAVGKTIVNPSEITPEKFAVFWLFGDMTISNISEEQIIQMIGENIRALSESLHDWILKIYISDKALGKYLYT